MASILIVDDEDTIIRLLKFSLSGAGYTVFTAKNGREALDFVAQNPVDLVISDLVMPEVGGIEICRELKGKCPVIIASGTSEEDKRIQASEAGAVDFIAKPYNLEQLKARVAEILQKNGKA